MMLQAKISANEADAHGGLIPIAGVDLGDGTCALLVLVGTRARSTPAVSAASAQLLAANPARESATITNPAGAAVLWVTPSGGPAVVGQGVRVAPGATYVVPSGYTGPVFGIWEAPGGGPAAASEITT